MRAEFADRIFALEAEDFAGRVVQVGDAAVGVGHDDPFLDGIENRLKKTFFLSETEEVILHFLRTNPAEATDEFFEKSRFHTESS